MLPLVNPTPSGGLGRFNSSNPTIGGGTSSSSSNNNSNSININIGGGNNGNHNLMMMMMMGGSGSGSGSGGGNLSLHSLQSHYHQFGSNLWTYLRRVVHITQMDFEFAMNQMVELVHSPIQVYRSSRNRKRIKDQWARDDPAFVVLLLVFVLVASLAYCIAFHQLNILTILRLCTWSLLFDFLILGTVIATVGWWIGNKYLLISFPHSSSRQHVEWLYAFDVHCNAFFPLFLILYVGQFILLPILYQDTFVARALSNTLYMLAFVYYHYVSFRGYLELPFLHHAEIFLYPILPIFLGFLVSFLFHFNCTRFMMHLYFG